MFASVLGNAGTLITYRVEAEDSPVMAAQHGTVEPRDLVNLPDYRAFVRTMVDGQIKWAFNMETMGS